MTASSDQLQYYFTSVGPRGHIQKVVQYTYISDLNVWNLGFGDLDEETGHINDSVVSNNGDGRTVLATVVRSLLAFLRSYPSATVLFIGSDKRRTHIYQRVVVRYYHEFLNELIVSGLSMNRLEETIETDKNYLASVIRKV